VLRKFNFSRFRHHRHILQVPITTTNNNNNINNMCESSSAITITKAASKHASGKQKLFRFIPLPPNQLKFALTWETACFC